jgi:hypothetical protein
VDKDGDRATEGLLDQAVRVQLVGQLHACLHESLRDLARQRLDGVPGVRRIYWRSLWLVEPQAAVLDPLVAESGAEGVVGAVANHGKLVLQPEGVDDAPQRPSG